MKELIIVTLWVIYLHFAHKAPGVAFVFVTEALAIVGGGVGIWMLILHTTGG